MVLHPRGRQHGPALAVLACKTAGWVRRRVQQQVPFTKRRHIVLIPCGAEAVVGHIMHECYLQEQRSQHAVLSAHDRDTVLVARVARRLIKAVTRGCPGGGFQEHLQLVEWQVTGIENGIANAFVVPGGHIVVHTGLLRLIIYDEDVLAMVLGHEMAHVFARHTAERVGLWLMFRASITVCAGLWRLHEERRRSKEREELRRQGKAVPAELEQPDISSRVIDLVLRPLYHLVMELPHSRRNEFEADLIGLKLMAMAQYDIKKAPLLFELLEGLHPSQEPFLMRLLSSHPESSSRAHVLHAEVAWMQLNPKLALEGVGTCPAQDHWVI